MIEMYMDTTTAFEGGDAFTKFGFEIRDSVKFTVSRKRFKRETGMERPIEGDLLYLPLNRGLFEIKFVEHENPFYQLGKLLSFQLTCELFQYSEEKMNTGIPEIDVVENDSSYNINLSLGVTGGTGTFTKGDTVYQYASGTTTGTVENAIARANVVSYNPNIPNNITLSNIVGKWSETTVGNPYYITNNSYYRIVIGVEDKFGVFVDESNKEIQQEAEQYFNFSEKHPFGEP
jgi:hypothetical protein